MRKKPTRKHPYFPMKPTVTAILRDASVKMHHECYSIVDDLHRKSRCEMLTGGDNITTDVITFLARVFQCSFTFTLVSASR